MLSRIKWVNILTLLLFLSVAGVLNAAEKADEHAVEEVHENSHGKNEGEAHGEEEFDIYEVVFEHIGDNHDWHLWSITNDDGSVHAVSFPLPVILINPNTYQVDVFLSSAFEHGHAVVTKGDASYFMHHQKIYYTDEHGTLEYNEKGEITNSMPIDLSITKNVSSMFLVAIIMLFIFILAAKAYNKRPGQAPKGLQGVVEPLILFVKNEIAIPNIGEKKHAKYLPYLLTVFFFILMNNLIGIIPIFPGSANVTGNIAVTMVLALFTFFIVNFNANKTYWRHIFAMPGLPKPLLIIMIPIELIGIITKPFALMIRLFANITAGHIVVISLISLIFIFKTIWLSLGSIPLVLFIDVLELFVAALQAYIFTMLSALFIGLAVQDHH